MESSRTPESQKADITALEPGDALNAVRMLIRHLSWSLTGIGRICCVSLTIGAYILSNFVEQGLRTLLPLTSKDSSMFIRRLICNF